MNDPLIDITIYGPHHGVNYQGRAYTQTIGTFPVTDACERNCTLMADDHIKLSFKSESRVVIPAFSYIVYDNQYYFMRETYRPVPKGNHYVYEMKFVSFSNMLSKPILYRHVTVDDESWDEPEVSVNTTLQGMLDIVKESIRSSASRFEQEYQGNRIPTVFSYFMSRLVIGSDTLEEERLETFSYSGQKVSEVLSDIASKFETEWWIEETGASVFTRNIVLHVNKCERTDLDMIEVTDEFTPTSDPLDPTHSGGLLSVEYSQEWSGVPQRITPYGSDRNRTGKEVIENGMYVSYGKKLRLQPNTTYNVKDADGETTQVTTDANGSLAVPGVSTGEEAIETFDDIYPRGHMRVVLVSVRGTDNPIYKVFCVPVHINADGTYTDYTDAEIDAMQADEDTALFPIKIAEGQTLSVHFESGLLNGREFEVADKSAKYTYDSSKQTYVVDPNGHWKGCFEIVPEGDNESSPQIPFGTFVPRGKTTTYDGDILSVFNMIMPALYETEAENELAQAAYDKVQEELATRPEVKCTADPLLFGGSQDILLGERVQVTSELFGDTAQTKVFVSRITSFSHSLTKPTQLTFKLASSQVIRGNIATLFAELADRTSDIQGVAQSARNLSRRSFNDAVEMRDMLANLEDTMMLVGNARYQFAYTMGIDVVNGNIVSGVNHFMHLAVTAGAIQHMQEPWIKDPNNGLYTCDAAQKSEDHLHHALSSNTEVICDSSHKYTPRLEPFYVFAHLNRQAGTATVELVASTEEKYLADTGGNQFLTNDDYMLLGTLSSEFDDFNNTAFRVFNRTNGYTQIAGGTITTEQIQDPTRSLIIDLSSNPPRILATRGAEIIGHIKFLMPNGQTKTVDEVVGEEVDKIEIGGENLYDGGDRAITATKYNANLTFDNGKNYVITIDHITDTSSTYLQWLELTDGTNVIDKIVLSDTFPKVIKWQGKGGVFGLRSARSGQGSTYVYGLMVQQGTKATDYQEYVKHLADTFLNQARAGSTDIQGGLLMTNVLQLRNEQGNVTAGMSGLSGTQQTPENVLMWGGGTYADAVHAADPQNNYQKLDGTLITTLYKKDGTGKLGIFKVGDDKAVIDVPGKGVIVIDADDGLSMQDTSGKERIMVVPNNIAAYSPIAPIEKTMNYPNTGFTGSSSGTKNHVGSFTINRASYVTIKHGFFRMTNCVVRRPGYTSEFLAKTVNLSLRIYKGGALVGAPLAQSSFTTSDTGYVDRVYQFEEQNRFFASPGTYDVEVFISFIGQETYESFSSERGDACYIDYIDEEQYDAKTIIGIDGIISAIDSRHFFKVINEGTNQKVSMVGLPETASDEGQICLGTQVGDYKTLVIRHSV